ncbi:NUDIX domain-containing protein [Nonomuraea sp. NPDC059194]|uniref:NUDIX hydrolase n=1 Tax=Nonomuraea sp. NPDC059194 TaxID=3346764 RepID=UPI003683ACFF
MAAKDGDGWALCARGHRHWGLYGAAGLLAVHRDDEGVPRVLMQERALWSHHGGTWGLPGGARDSHEESVHTALREASEEAALSGEGLRVRGVYRDDHGGWTFDTVIAEAATLLPAVPGNEESKQLRWFTVPEVGGLKLHPGFAESWPQVQAVMEPDLVVLDIANIVGARAEHGWWKDRQAAAARLLADTAGASLPHQVLAQWFPDVVAVVEGAARGVPSVDGIAVVDADGSGDDAIIEVVRQAKPWERVLVVTADRALRELVTGLGALVTGPKWLLDRL